MTSATLTTTIERLAKPLFDAGAKEVYVIECCDRIFVGKFAPTGCRTCGMPVKAEVILHSAIDKD